MTDGVKAKPKIQLQGARWASCSHLVHSTWLAHQLFRVEMFCNRSFGRQSSMGTNFGVTLGHHPDVFWTLIAPRACDDFFSNHAVEYCSAMAQQLEQLNKEIAAQAAEVRAAMKDWLNATDLQQKADLKEVWQRAVTKEDALLETRIRALEAKLHVPGDVLGIGKAEEQLQLSLIFCKSRKGESQPSA